MLLDMPFLILTNEISNLICADGNPKYSMVCMVAGAVAIHSKFAFFRQKNTFSIRQEVDHIDNTDCFLHGFLEFPFPCPHLSGILLSESEKKEKALISLEISAF